MSTNKSENLGLHLWEAEDDFLRTEFNENFTAIDGAMKQEQDTRAAAVTELEGKITASGSGASAALGQAKQELNAAIQAEQSARSQAVQQEQNARTQADAELQTQVDAAYSDKKRAVICGSYVGTGTHGSSNPNVLTVGFRPSCLMIANESIGLFAAISPDTAPANNFRVTWREDGVSWYHGNSTTSQMNTAGMTYYYLVFR